MQKPVKKTGVLKKLMLLALSAIHWFQSDQSNERAESFGTPEQDFPRLFAENGWNGIDGVQLYRLDATQVAAALVERAQTIAGYRARGTEKVVLFVDAKDVETTATFAEVAAHIEKLWAKSPPEFGGNCGYRRGFASPLSSLAHKLVGGGDLLIPGELLPESQCTLEGRFWARLRENSQAGRAGYGLLDQFGIAMNAVAFGANEKSLEDPTTAHMTRATAQKTHSWALIATRFPELDLVSRFSLSVPAEGAEVYTKGGYVSLRKLNPGMSRSLRGKVKTDKGRHALAVEAMSSIAGSECGAGSVANVAQIEEFFRLVCTKGSSNKPKILDRATIDQLKGSTPSDIVRSVLAGVLDNDGSKIGEANVKVAAMAAQAKAGAIAVTENAVLLARIATLEAKIVSLEATIAKTAKPKAKRTKKAAK